MAGSAVEGASQDSHSSCSRDPIETENGSIPALLAAGTSGDAPLAVACLLALPPAEAEAALHRHAAAPGAGFAAARRALLLGLFASALQALPYAAALKGRGQV